MDKSSGCSKCGGKSLSTDDVTGNMYCNSCGQLQEFDNYQQTFYNIDGPTGTYIRTGTSGTGTFYNYKETKIYKAKLIIEDLLSFLDFSQTRKDQVRIMVHTITEGEYGQGDWFPVLVGACAYVVMKNENTSLLLSEVADKVNCELYELGRMVHRVVDFLDMNLPEFNIVSVFERRCRSYFHNVPEEKFGIMLKQGIFLVQCMVKWYLTTGRRPLQVVAAVLLLVAQLNDMDGVRIESIASELNVPVSTCRLRYKELLDSLVKVAKPLPWGKDVTVKNIVKNAPFVIQYMEMKSMVKTGNKSKSTAPIEFDLSNLVEESLMREEYYGIDNEKDELTSKDACYFEPKHSLPSDVDELENLKISPDCLFKIYSEMWNEVSTKACQRSHARKKRGEFVGGVSDCIDWWKGESELSKKLVIKKILEKDVGLIAEPPAFTAGCLIYERRREKIRAAKQRIDKIMCPWKLGEGECKTSVGKRKRSTKKATDSDWEDMIIETLLLHMVKEEEIEKGYYNTLIDLYVFNPVSADCI
ncbi:plant-specific TFIIB-related protein PTF2 [Impatiens glandulifera]|uniref:plant-specific TFIIB-related protein PTF2 n=1 Tax=Impatiens glandulifera TaxID=253017 RepID=UPI001FB17C0A|nr:plant-specific TFIIB-related protein PTF2 [Impatiens glandulifera]